ncbi:MAG: fibro-slime domain-containing protein, partial [Proteobacteria bacterium]
NVVRSKRVDGLALRLARTGTTAATYAYEFNSATDSPYVNRSGFYPIEDRTDTWGREGHGRTYNFTTELRYWFTYDETQSPTLTFSGDDDVWVFVNNRLALDLGGLHQRREKSFTIDATTRAALGLQNGKLYEVALFHAERHTNASNFKLTLKGFVQRKSTCTPICGDGIRTSGEQCDNKDQNSSATPTPYGGCSTACKRGPYCGDKVVTASNEQCDDGSNLTPWTQVKSTTSCAPGCKLPGFCGDGVKQFPYEQCDNGTLNAGSMTAGDAGAGDGGASGTTPYNGCSLECRTGPRCGDGVTQSPQEECDDGNRASGDGCSSACRTERSGPK